MHFLPILGEVDVFRNLLSDILASLYYLRLSVVLMLCLRMNAFLLPPLVGLFLKILALALSNKWVMARSLAFTRKTSSILDRLCG